MHSFVKRAPQFHNKNDQPEKEIQSSWILEDLWRSSSPTPLLEKQSPRAGCISSGMTTPQALWATCCHVWPLSLGQKKEKKELFLMCNFLSFSLCPLPLIMSLDTTGKGLAPLSLSPSSGVYTRLYDPPQGLGSLRLNSSSSRNLSLCERCSISPVL